MAIDREGLIRELCDREWRMFDQVDNRGGRASCQNDEVFFRQMRACQFEGWSDAMLLNYRDDLCRAEARGRNLLAEKYAYMMEHTHPEEFEALKERLPKVDPVSRALIVELVRCQVEWEQEVDSIYPHMRAGGRPLTRDRDTPFITSFETYLEGELKTYSLATLRSYAEHVRKLKAEGRNLALIVAEHTARAYGYASLADAEEKARLTQSSGIR